MLRQHLPAKRIDLAKRHGLHAGAFKPEREAADAGEQIKHAQPATWHVYFP